MSTYDVELFKKVLSELESSGGINTEHKTITSGIHKGTSAKGQYGLMLNTAKEMAKRKAKKDNADLELLNIQSDDEFESYLQKYPQKYDEMVNRLVNHVWQKSVGDIPTAATMWRWGHNLSKEKAEEILKNKPAYKERIISILNKLEKGK